MKWNSGFCDPVRGHHFQPGFDGCDCGHFKLVTHTSNGSTGIDSLKAKEVLDPDPKDEVIKILKAALVHPDLDELTCDCGFFEGTDGEEIAHICIKCFAGNALAAVEKLEKDE